MKTKRQWLTGFIFIVIGVVLLLGNLGYIDVSFRWIMRNLWPLALILIGVSFLDSRKGTGEVVTGLVLITLGILILGNRQGWFSIDFYRFWTILWPVVLILIGISFLGVRAVGGRNLAFLSGIEKTKSSWVLDDGTYWAIMGGIDMDLNKASIESGREYLLSCNVLMGGIEITVPKDATVYCKGRVLLGGLELLDDETGGIIGTLQSEQISDQPGAPIIRIESRAALGGIEIKSR